MKSPSVEGSQPFLSDIRTLRARARERMDEGAVTPSYGGDLEKTIDILQTVLATEIVCTLRYTQHAIVAKGLASEGVKAEFADHARDENAHAAKVAERIDQLGGVPDFNPQTLTGRSASEYQTSDNLVTLIRENLVAERIAAEHYRELVRYFGNDDPVTRVMIEEILTVEEEHANDMLDLLQRHGGLGKKGA